MTLVRNIDLNQSCPVCLDEGWVELLGTTTALGVVYERGMTCCIWCQIGTRAGSNPDRRGSQGGRPVERDYEMEQLGPLSSLDRIQTFEQYVAASPDDANVPAAIEMLSKVESKAALYVLAYRARSQAWGADRANEWVRATVNEKQAEWIIAHST